MPTFSSVLSRLNEHDLDDIFNHIDLDGDGYISMNEFTSSCAYNLLTEHNLEQAFKTLDIDKNGQIEKKELQEAFYI